MKPENSSNIRLAITRSKGKMYEYNVPEESHIAITSNPEELFLLTIGLLGDVSAYINSENTDNPEYREANENLQFAAQFFDAYLQSKLDQDIDNYLILVGAASYYLCDFPGSANVLIRELENCNIELNTSGLDQLLFWILRGRYDDFIEVGDSRFSIDRIQWLFKAYYLIGELEEELIDAIHCLKTEVYDSGDSRELLFADVIGAVIRKKIHISSWNCLPKYTDLSRDEWAPIIVKDSFIKELWPAQKLLGERGVFNGVSAVVQMPTSAGKTKSTEITIRSAFLSNRADLAVIVAPFRALCHEIKNSMTVAFMDENVKVDEPSDVIQADFDISDWVTAEKKQIIVVTPEKLLYILRNSPELAVDIGLIIFDEGHQFDSGTRGVTYELLLASIKSMIPEDAQIILISAVISNAEEIGHWLGGGEIEIIEGSFLSPTDRTIAFTSWIGPLGRIEYVSKSNPDHGEFYVPRVIEQQSLSRRGRERTERRFPDKEESNDVALYLGLKLVANGAVGIFCGRKDTVSNLCAKIVDIYERDFTYPKPAAFSEVDEIDRLARLHEKHYGPAYHLTKCAGFGIFAHSAYTPQGLRLSIEHAMEQGHAKYVICTSTLAQGVNLPLRYLIVTSVYQGLERIKVRDFHNLIGRVGRSGMHTEGSIIFADQRIYDDRHKRIEKWRWSQAKELLNQENSEPCNSTITSLFDPFSNEDESLVVTMEPLEFIEQYVAGKEIFDAYIQGVIDDLENQGFTEKHLKPQIAWKLNIIAAIESYLMSYATEENRELTEDDVVLLAQTTLAYYTAEREQQQQIIALFKLLAESIAGKVTPEERQLYGKTLFGINKAKEIEQWVVNNFEEINILSNPALFDCLWPILLANTNHKLIENSTNILAIKQLAVNWISGSSFGDLFAYIEEQGVQYRANTQYRNYKLDHMIDICEGAFSYNISLVMGAITSFVELHYPEEGKQLIRKLNQLQKYMKYGLGSMTSITLYELGFADRCLAQDLVSIIGTEEHHRTIVKVSLKRDEEQIRSLLNSYPAYYTKVYETFV